MRLWYRRYLLPLEHGPHFGRYINILYSLIIIVNNAGSPKYMSPEVLIYKSPANPSMDIWSLGIILFRMIYGVYPFEADSRKEIFEKIKKGFFDFPEDNNISLSC